MLLDCPHQLRHLFIVLYLKGMVTESMERMELGKFQIDQLALVNGSGRGHLLRGLCRRPCAGGSAASGGL